MEKVLRTPDERFKHLADFNFEPHYIDVLDKVHGPLRMHYLDEGAVDAPVILCLHGQATWSYMYRKLIPRFVDAGYRVIAPDFIGFGRSDKLADESDYTFYKHVAWLKAFLDSLNIKATHAFLFDWGGYFALPIAAQHPDYFASLTLVTTKLPRAGGVIGPLWVAWWRRHSRKGEKFSQADMVKGMTDSEMSQPVWDAYEAPYPDESYKKAPRSFPMLIPATRLNPATKRNREAWAKLKQWQKPTITIVSERLAKHAFKPSEFHQHIPGTQGQSHQIIANAGFFVVEDAPEQVVDTTLAFLEKNFPR
jgi:haloalkane dehalogenase